MRMNQKMHKLYLQLIYIAIYFCECIHIVCSKKSRNYYENGQDGNYGMIELRIVSALS